MKNGVSRSFGYKASNLNIKNKLKSFTSLSLKTIAVAGVLATTTFNLSQAEGNYILSTASAGGTYYPVGVALATLTKVKLQPKQKISMSAITSAGSGENVKLLREKEAHFAILQGLYGGWAWNGEGAVAKSGKQPHLRSVSMLWQNVEQFSISSKFKKTGDMSDLNNIKGESFSIGKRNSGTEGSGRHILNALGYKPDEDFNLAYQGYGPSSESLQNGTIAGMNTPAGVPTSAVTSAFANLDDDITLLSFTDEQLKQVNAKYPLWTKFAIKSGTYPNQKSDVTTVAQPNFLATHMDVSEDDVYKIVKTIYENLGFLNGIHKATKAMSLEKAIAGLPVPLHPGAAKYYKEMGLDVPDRLMAK